MTGSVGDKGGVRPRSGFADIHLPCFWHIPLSLPPAFLPGIRPLPFRGVTCSPQDQASAHADPCLSPQPGGRCPPPCHMRKPRLRWGHSEGATLEPPGCSKLLALGSPDLRRSGPGRVPPTHCGGWGQDVAGQRGRSRAWAQRPAPPLLTRLHVDLESSFSLQTSPPRSPCWGLSPMAAGRVGAGRATAAPRAPWPGAAPSLC